MNKTSILMIIIYLSLLWASHYYTYSVYTQNLQIKNEAIDKYKQLSCDLTLEYEELIDDYTTLDEDFKKFEDTINEIEEVSPIPEIVDNKYQQFRTNILQNAEINCTPVTIIYYTDFGQTEQQITLSIPYEKYRYYQTLNHPNWGVWNLIGALEYITSDDPVIIDLVNIIKYQTNTQEELANALLNFVQDKGYGLCLRHYPSKNLKYPIETLVEMGGDCDTHALLYATLLKTAGFKTLLLFSHQLVEGYPHVAIAVNLKNPPTNSLQHIENSCIVYEGENYYFAETTKGNWRIGDLPPKLNNITFQTIYISNQN